MFRFIKYFLRPDYEECKGCQILQRQLHEVNLEKKELLNVVIDIVRPKVVEVPEKQHEISPIIPKVGTWTRRRAILEERDRKEAAIKNNSQFIGHPDNSDITRIEKELGIGAEGVNGNAGKE